MQGKTHEIIGIAAASTIICSTQIRNTPIYCTALLVGTIIGSFIPDIDLQTSTAGQKFKIISWPIALIRTIMRCITRIFSSLKGISRLLAHRGIFHAPLFYLLIYGILFTNNKYLDAKCYYFLQGLFLGIFLHLTADFFSGGIPLFCPFYNKRIIPFIKFKSSGGINIIMIAVSSLLIAYNLVKIVT